MRYKFRDYNFEDAYVSCKDFSFLRQAAKQAAGSNHHKFRLGAVVVKSGRVMGNGVNTPKKSPDTPPQRESVHAEVNALKSVKDPEGATIYVARLSVHNEMALAKPCEYCIEHLIANGVYRVVFSVAKNIAQSFYLDSIEWNGYLTKQSGLTIPYVA